MEQVRDLAELSMLDCSMIAVYTIGMLLIGIYCGRNTMKGRAFFYGDGRIPWWASSISIFATLMSPISFFGLATNSYAGTWRFWFANLGAFCIAMPFAIYYFMPIYRRLRLESSYHYLELRFESRGLRVLGALMFAIYQMGRMTLIMVIPALAFSEMTGYSPTTLVLSMGVVTILYTTLGGMKATVWTDLWQGIIMLVGCTWALVYILNMIDGGTGTVMNLLVNEHKFLDPKEHFFGPELWSSGISVIFIGAGLNGIASFVAGQDIVQRLLTTNKLGELRKMLIGNGVMSFYIATILYLMGTALYAYYQQVGGDALMNLRPTQAYSYFILTELPDGLVGLLLVSGIAAAQSTLSTGLHSVATSWVLDVQNFLMPQMKEEHRTRFAQGIVFMLGCFVLAVALAMVGGTSRVLYEWFNAFMGLMLGALAGVFFLGAFTRTGSELGAYFGFFLSAFFVLYLKYFVPSVSFWAYMFATVIISILSGIVVSMIQKKYCGESFLAPKGTTVYDKD